MGKIVRRRRGKGFVYIGPSGRAIKSARRLKQFRALAVPPAWNKVRLSEDPEASVLAVGQDSKGRRQYIYNPAFRAGREAEKYKSLGRFAAGLPRLRARIARDLRQRESGRIWVTALCARLIDRAGIRVGSPTHRRSSGTFGATTLQKRHVRVRRGVVRLDFVGKGGKSHNIQVRDGLLADGLKKLLSTPGDDLFRYRGAAETWVTVSPTTLNQYLRDCSDAPITAKIFRTWKATTVAARELARSGPDSPLKPALDRAAAELGNTAAIVRNSYVHPEIFASHASGTLQDLVTAADGAAHMPAVEKAVADLICQGKQAK